LGICTKASIAAKLASSAYRLNAIAAQPVGSSHDLLGDTGIMPQIVQLRRAELGNQALPHEAPACDSLESSGG
jgi:hypothetical protein